MSVPPSSAAVRAQDDSEEIRLVDLLDNLIQHIWVVVGVFAVALVCGIAYSVIATPIYSADALVQVEQKKSGTLGGQEIAEALGTNSTPVSGEIEILRSREVILQAAAATNADVRVIPKRFPVIGNWWARTYRGFEPVGGALGLGSYAWGGEVLKLGEFKLPEGANGRRFVVTVTDNGFRLADSAGHVLAEGEPGKVLPFSVDGQDARIYVSELKARSGVQFYVVRDTPISVYRRIRSGLSIEESARGSGVIRVSYRHPDMDFARNLVNSIAKTYLKQNVERRSAEADQSLKFLEEQLPLIKRNVERAEEALNSFRTKTNTISVEKSVDSLLQKSVEAERERMQLELKRDELLQVYRPEHPELKALESKIAAINERNRSVNAQVSRLPATQRDLLRLQRDVEVSNQLYIALLNNAQQLRVAKAGTVGNVRIIDFALSDPAPVAPRKSLVILASVVLGLILGVAGAMLVRVLRPTLRDAAEVERTTGLVSYASVPESPAQAKLASAKRGRSGRLAIVPGRSQLLATLSPNDVAIESLRSLRTGLTFASLGAKDKNVVVTGATPALGKSFISANLSALLASSGKRVLLIETDMRRPQLGAYFGQKSGPGLSDVLAKSVSYGDALVRNAGAVDRLDVLFAGQVPPNPGELLLSEEFENLVNRVQGDYDHIVLDTPPVLPVGDSLAVVRHASIIFLVVRAEVSTKGEVIDAVRKLESVDAKVKGIIFNGVKRRRVGYGYEYRYYYGYGDKV